MAKKKKSIDLTQNDILFELNNEKFKVLRFYPSNMTVDIKSLQEKAGVKNIPFAHLPKNIKQMIKPK